MQVSHAITRRSASNLALAFILLPKPKRHAMSALYAFCREVDDIADDDHAPVAQRRKQLTEWRNDIGRACRGEECLLPVNRELQPAIQLYRLPFELFDELLKGVEMDLEVNRYATVDDLEKYCYRVASVVGLLSIEVFGYADHASRSYAIHLGKALQFTNILRDVKVDADRGRIYLPLSELDRFQVRPEEIIEGRYSDRFEKLARSIADRARSFYAQARATLPEADRRSMATAELMGSVYWRLLQQLERRRFNVFESPTTRLSKAEKIFLIGRTWFRLWSGRLVPNYGTS